MSNQIDITGGARVRNLNGVITGSTGVLSSLPINGANGIPQLDSSGKILVSQLPNSVMEFLGTWNAATNTPTLVNGTGNAGDVYLCTVAGTVDFGAGPITFQDGDYVVYSGSTWERSSGAMGTVTSVGASITGNSIGITGSPVTTAGTLAFAFAGTAAQYVNGAGNLVTFPTTIAQAQRLITEVYNETGATLTKGTVVYINGGHGNLPTVTKAIATGDSTSAQTYGVVQNDITDNNNGYVVVIGSLGDLDTQAYAAGTQLYLSSTTAGAWTSTKQYAPAHLVYVGIVVRSHPTQGVVEVRIQNGFELDELHNVSAQTPSNNQGLFYNSSNQLWENKSIATALGYTPANQALVVPYTGATTDVDLGIYELQASLLKSTGILESDLGILTSYGITINKTGQSAGAGAGQMQMFAPTGTSSSISFQDGNSFYISRFNFDNTGNRTYTFPNASGTVALTSDISYPVTSVFGRTGAVVATEGDYSLTQLSDVTITTPSSGQVLRYNGSSWVNSTESYVGTVTSVGLSAPTGFSVTNSPVTSSGTLTLAFAAGYSLPTAASQTNWDTAYTNRITSLTTTGSSGSATLISNTLNVPTYTLSGLGGQPLSTNLTSLSGLSYVSASFVKMTAAGTFTLDTNVYYLASNPNGYTSNVGTVTSVAALTIGTSGTDLSSTVANSTTTPVITLNVPTASATNRGALSSTDWNTFNNKQSALTNPVTGTGTTNYLPKFTGTSTIGNSAIYDNGGNIGIGTTTAATKLDLGSNYGSPKIYLYNDGTFVNGFGIYANEFRNFFDTIDAAASRMTWGKQTAGGTFTEFIRLTKDGNVLIGTTTDAGYKLDVNGTGRFSGAVTAKNGATNASVLPAFLGANEFMSTGSLAGFFMENRSGGVTASTNWAGWYYSGTKIRVYNGSADIFSMEASTGAATFSSSVTAGGNLLIKNSSNNAIGYLAQEGDLSGTLYLYNNGTLKNVFATNGNSYITGGNVGIGTSSPNGKLTIDNPAGGNRASLAFDIYENYARIQAYGNGTSLGSIALNPLGNNVLIGTTTDAGYKLDVNGTGRFSNSIQEMLYVNSSSASGTVFRLGNTSTGGGDFRFYSSGSGNGEGAGRLLLTFNGASPILNIAGTGAATFSSSVTANTLNATNSVVAGTSVEAGTSVIANVGYGFRSSTYRSGYNPIWAFNTATAYGMGYYQVNTDILGIGQDAIGFHFGDTSNPSFFIKANGGAYFGNNVGIGTKSPDTALQAIGGISARTNTTGDSFYRLYLDSSIVGHWYADRAGSKVNIGSVTSIPLVLETSATERMRITSGGVVQIANASGTQGTLVGSERLNVNGGIYAYGDITSGGTITFANNVVNYGGNTTYKGATGSGDVTLSNNGSALLVTGPLQKNYGSSIKFVGNGSSSYDVDFLNAGFTTKTVKVLGSVHLETTDSSFVIPRMTTTQRDALNANNKIAGAMIYNTSVGHFQGYNGSGWTNFW